MNAYMFCTTYTKIILSKSMSDKNHYIPPIRTSKSYSEFFRRTRAQLSCSKPAMRSAQCWSAWSPVNQTRLVSKWGWLCYLYCLYWRLDILTEKEENIKSHSARLILLQWTWNQIPLGTSAAILRRKTLDFTWLQPDWSVEVQKF